MHAIINCWHAYIVVCACYKLIIICLSFFYIMYTASCNCPDGLGYCIMTAVSRSVPTKWSQCSKDQLNRGFVDYNLDRCLFNIPHTSVGGQTCGDGILEGDEECDCGGVSVSVPANYCYDINLMMCFCAAPAMHRCLLWCQHLQAVERFSLQPSTRRQLL